MFETTTQFWYLCEISGYVTVDDQNLAPLDKGKLFQYPVEAFQSSPGVSRMLSVNTIYIHTIHPCIVVVRLMEENPSAAKKISTHTFHHVHPTICRVTSRSYRTAHKLSGK